MTDKKTCRHCRYFRPMLKRVASWGNCTFFNDRPRQVVPIWAEPVSIYHSVPPTQEGCEAWEKRKHRTKAA